MKLPNMREKKTTKCDKSTVKCDVVTAQHEVKLSNVI